MWGDKLQLRLFTDSVDELMNDRLKLFKEMNKKVRNTDDTEIKRIILMYF